MVTRSRGQVILIGAVLVAVIFVSLAFVVNAAISTDTVSVEGIEDVRNDEALQIQREVRNATREAIERNQSSGIAFSTVFNEDFRDSLRAQYAHGDQYVQIQIDSFANSVPEATIKFIYHSPQTHYEATITVSAP